MVGATAKYRAKAIDDDEDDVLLMLGWCHERGSVFEMVPGWSYAAYVTFR
jgi:hypothetical protein